MDDDDDDFGLDATGDLDLNHDDGHGRGVQPQAERRPSGGGIFRSDSDDLGASDDGGLSGGAAQFPPRPGAPLPPPRRESGGDLFDDGSGEIGDDGFGLSADDGLSGDIELDHQPPPTSRPLPPPAADYTNPSLSLDANDSELDDLLGPQSRTMPPAPLPPRAASLPPVPPPDSGGGGGYGLGEEDSELADLLGEGSSSGPPPPLPPVLAPLPAPTRRISFQDPVAVPVAMPQPRGGMPARPPSRSEDYDDVRDSEEGFGLEEEAEREAAALPAQRSRRNLDDFGSESRYPPAGAGASFKRVPSPGSGYGPLDDPLDSPVSGDRPPPRVLPGRSRVGGSSEAYVNYGDEYGEGDDFEYDDDGFDGPEPAGPAFRRVPAPDQRGTPANRGRQPRGPASGDMYEDDYYEDDDEDPFADDVSWDGEIRQSHVGARNTAGRPGSAGHPRSRGPHATGSRRRPQSAMAPRERQAAMLEDMQTRHPSTWDIREVATWLDFIGMGQYRSKFVHHSVDGMLLLTLGEPELARDLRILPLGHRRALLGAIEALKTQAEEMEKAGREGVKMAKTEDERLADLRRRAAEQPADRRPASAGANVLLPEPFLGPAQGKMTVYEQRAKLLYQLDRTKHRAAQHAAIIEQLTTNKALTDAQVAELRGKLKDLESKHRDEFSPTRRPGMTAPVASGRGGDPGGGGYRGAAALADAEYGADAAIPWLPVGRGTQVANPHPERFTRVGEDPDLDLTFRPRTTRIEEVPPGAVRDIVSKALGSRTPFWQRMDFEFEKMRKERERKEEARRKRRERMGTVKRGGEGDEDEKSKSPYWNNFWVPGSQKNSSSHKHFKKSSENDELNQYRSFTKDKVRLSRWFKRFVDDDEPTEGDVTLEQLINRMIRALVKTKDQMEMDFGDSFETRIRRYFEERGYKFATNTSNTIMVRARGTRPPAPNRPDTTLYDFEEVEQYYPDYLKKTVQTAPGDDDGGDDGEETRMVPKRTTWKRLVDMYYMDRQKKIRAAVAMVKMSQFVQRHGAKFPPERDKDTRKKKIWIPCNHNIVFPPDDWKPVLVDKEDKEDKLFARMGWPHSSGDPSLGPPEDPQDQDDPRSNESLGNEITPRGNEWLGNEITLDDFGGQGDQSAFGEGGGGPPQRAPWQPRRRAMDFFQALDGLLDQALELRHRINQWDEAWNRADERGYGYENLSEFPPKVEDLDWRGNPLVSMQDRQMDRDRQQLMERWTRERELWERRADSLRNQGYWEEDIDKRLGPPPEADDVGGNPRNHLYHNVSLLARFKPEDLMRFREKLNGTKKKMAVYRALCFQMFVDEVREKQQAREDKVQRIYESYRRREPRAIPEDQREDLVLRMEEDRKEREQRRQELLASKLEEESSTRIPWFMQPLPTIRNPPPRPQPPIGRPKNRIRKRDTTDSLAKYVFGSSTPKSMWAPLGPARTPFQALYQQPQPQSRYFGRGESLLDSPGLRGLHGDPSAASVGLGSPGRTRGRGGAATPTHHRATPPGRADGAAARGQAQARGQNAGPSAQWDCTGASPGAATPPSPARAREGGRGGTPARARQSPSSVPATPPSPRGRGRPASTPRQPGGPPMNPRHSPPRVGLEPGPSPARSRGRNPSRGRGWSGAGGPGGRGPASGAGSSAGAGRPRQGLMDGDTSGTSASPSPQQRQFRRQGAPGRPQDRDEARNAQQRRGLGDTDSSPSPQPRRPKPRWSQPPAQPPSTRQHPAAGGRGAAPAETGPPSRQLSHGIGMSGPAGGLASGGASRARTGSTGGGGLNAEAPQPRPRRPSGMSTPPSGLSQQGSAASGLGMARPSSRPGERPRGSGLGSGTGPVSGTAGLAPVSRRSSTPTGIAPPLERQASLASRLSSGSGRGVSGGPSGRGSGSGGAVAGGGGGGSSSGATPGPMARTPLARSPVSASPRAGTPPSRSPPQSPPPGPEPQASDFGGSGGGAGGGGGFDNDVDGGDDDLRDLEPAGVEQDDLPPEFDDAELDMGQGDESGEEEF